MADYVYLAGSEEEFVTKLDLAVAENDRDLAERRRAFARSNTWTERYRAIEAGLRSSAQRASIIIVTYNNLSLTALCLHSVVSNTEYPDYEVIVVDNNSTDGTPEYLKSAAERVSNLKIILNTENRGFACANNQGIKASTGKYLVLLNNDTVVPQGWLTRLLRHLDDPEIGLVGPMTNAVGNEAKVDVQYRTWAEMERFAEMMTWKNDGKIADIAMLAMFCVALRRDTYEVVGPLDEQFGIGMFEDDDYSRRIRQRHFRIVCAADVFVHHVGQAAFKALIKSGEYYSLFDENRRLFELKWGIEWIPHRHGQLRFEIHSAGSHKPGS
jgi:GT2 family glycosyltransferase